MKSVGQMMVHVAVGLVFHSNGKVLVAKRADDAHQGGLWEFPGGKVETHESVDIALARELREELDIHISAASPVMQIPHDYGDKKVLLDVWAVNAFSGTPIGREGQAIKWLSINELSSHQFPKANKTIVQWLEQQTDTANA